MKPFFVGLALTAPTVAVLLYFSLQGRQQITYEQQEFHAKQDVDDAKFDADFAAGWDGKSIAIPKKTAIADASKKLDSMIAAHAAANAENVQDVKDLRDSMEIASGEKKPDGKSAAETAALKKELGRGGAP